MNEENQVAKMKYTDDRNIGNSIITFGTILNASYLIDDNPISISGILDLFALIEALVFNEKLIFIPILEEEISQHQHTHFFNYLLKNNILKAHILSDSEEKKISSYFTNEFKKLGESDLLGKLLKKISKTMKNPDVFRKIAYKTY